MNIEELKKIANLFSCQWKDVNDSGVYISVWNGFANSENENNLYLVNHEDDTVVKIPEERIAFVIASLAQELDCRIKYLNKLEKNNEQTK
jgi:hypothetical protein